MVLGAIDNQWLHMMLKKEVSPPRRVLFLMERSTIDCCAILASRTPISPRDRAPETTFINFLIFGDLAHDARVRVFHHHLFSQT